MKIIIKSKWEGGREEEEGGTGGVTILIAAKNT